MLSVSSSCVIIECFCPFSYHHSYFNMGEKLEIQVIDFIHVTSLHEELLIKKNCSKKLTEHSINYSYKNLRLLHTKIKTVSGVDASGKSRAGLYLSKVITTNLFYIYKRHQSNCLMTSLIVGLLIGSCSMHCWISITMAGCCTRWRRASHSSGLGNRRLHISSRRTP